MADIKQAAGSTAYTWGTTGEFSGAISVSRKTSCKVKEATGPNGAVIRVKVIEVTKTIDMEAYAAEAAGLPEVGVVVAGDGGQFLVLEAGKVEKAEDYATRTLSLKRWVTASLPS